MNPTSSSGASDDGAFSFDAMVAAVMGSAVLAERVAHEFLRLKPLLSERFERAVATREAQALCAVAHELRGMALNMGATRLAQVATQLEQRADAALSAGAFDDDLLHVHEVLMQEWCAVAGVLRNKVSGP